VIISITSGDFPYSTVDAPKKVVCPPVRTDAEKVHQDFPPFALPLTSRKEER
jgi:hypothetical protein